MKFGVGEGESISLFDQLSGGSTVHNLIHGKSYESKYAAIGQQLGGLQGSQQAWLMKALAAIEKGYGNADSALANQGALGTKMLLDRERQALGSNKQDMISRGLYGSTALDAANRGTAMDTNQGLADLSSMLAQIGSNVKISEGRDIAGAYGNLAQSDQNYQNLLLQLGLNTEYGEQGGMGGLFAGILGSFTG